MIAATAATAATAAKRAARELWEEDMMRRSVLVLDLETVIDASIPRRATEKDRSAKADEFPPAPYHRIVAVGAALLGPGYAAQKAWIIGEGEGEEAALEALTALLDERSREGSGITVVGWNSRGFDMPVLTARCLRHGVPFLWYYRQRDARYRYSAEGHLDLMDFLINFGASRPYTLDAAAKLIGMPGKIGEAGADVGAMFEEGRLEDVRSYCLRDVVQTTAVFLRTELLRGEIGRDEYRAAIRRLLRVCERDPRLAPMLPHVDLARLLLVASPSEPDPEPPPPAAQPQPLVEPAPAAA